MGREAATALVFAVAIGSIVASIETATADATSDVQLIGLAPLYEALYAVSYCPNVALDEPAFRRAARLYHLSTVDFTIDGRFSTEIAELTSDYRVRLEDDPATFCSVGRLSFSVPQGVLIDGGPVIPHPLPFALPHF